MATPLHMYASAMGVELPEAVRVVQQQQQPQHGENVPPTTAARATLSSSTSSRVPSTQSNRGCGGSPTPLSKPALLLRVFTGVILGFLDSIQIFTFLGLCLRSTAIMSDFLRCLVLNGVLLYSLQIISDVVAPAEAPAVAVQAASSTGGDIFAVFWSAVFSVGWVVPMYAVTQILGLTWWENLYKETVIEKHKRDGLSLPPKRSFTFTDVGEAALKFVTTLIFALVAQSSKIIGALLPLPFGAFLGDASYFFLGSLLHAFYCFDYRFADQGTTVNGTYRPIKLSTVFRLFELCWPYYFGYGASNVAMRTILEMLGVPTFAVLAVYSTVFCVNVVTSVDANPGPEVPGLQLPVFSELLSLVVRTPALWRRGVARVEAHPTGKLFVKPARWVLNKVWEVRVAVFGVLAFVGASLTFRFVFRLLSKFVLENFAVAPTA